MPKLRVQCFGISLDGFSAGPGQSLENPIGVNGTAVFGWFFGTRVFRVMHGQEGGSTGIDNEFAERGFKNIGAWIIGRNMFGPVRGPWPDESWKGWWGDEPPYHTPVFVLTHHARPSLSMQGDTTFHFVNDSIENTLARAFEAAQGKDVRLGGGVATIRQFLSAALVDEIHLAYSYALLGAGESLLSGINLHALGYELTAQTASEHALHVKIVKKQGA